MNNLGVEPRVMRSTFWIISSLQSFRYFPSPWSSSVLSTSSLLPCSAAYLCHFICIHGQSEGQRKKVVGVGPLLLWQHHWMGSTVLLSHEFGSCCLHFLAVSHHYGVRVWENRGKKGEKGGFHALFESFIFLYLLFVLADFSLCAFQSPLPICSKVPEGKKIGILIMDSSETQDISDGQFVSKTPHWSGWTFLRTALQSEMPPTQSFSFYRCQTWVTIWKCSVPSLAILSLYLSQIFYLIIIILF